MEGDAFLPRVLLGTQNGCCVCLLCRLLLHCVSPIFDMRFAMPTLFEIA
jgi:hypothetical protein